MLGIIALDIDGTITAEANTLEPEIIRTLTDYASAGWQLFFVTGRSFIWAHRVLKDLPFTYLFAVQNGATLLKMPGEKVLANQSLTSSIFPTMERICSEEPSDFVVYGGYSVQDACYYRPAYFEKKMRTYVETRFRTLKETWIPINSFAELPIQTFSSVKCFGDTASAQRIASRIESQLKLHVPLIKDPFDRDVYVIQATHSKVNKGAILQTVLELKLGKRPVIAAGDDFNDLPLLQTADIKIVMGSAPAEMLKMADIIAPPATEKGIVQGLQNAVKRLKGF